MNKIKAIILIAAVSLLMTACEDQEKNKLDNRVVDYWKYKVDRNFKEAYKFLSPGWRANESEIAYAQRMSQSAIKWTGIKLKEKKCTQKDLCEVTVIISYEYKFSAVGKTMNVESDLHENWILKNNTWYHLPIKKKLSKT
jgi:hypothetical protein